MCGAGDTDGTIGEFLARSHTRRRILSRLRTDSYDLRDLSDELGTPRTTIQDNLYKMEELDLITRTHDGEYVATPVGRVLIEEFREFGRTARIAKELEPFLRHVEDPQDDLDVSVLEGATLVEPTEQNPYKPATRLLAHLEQSTRFRALVPVVTPMCIKQIGDRATEGRLDAEVVLCREAMRCLEEDYGDPFATHAWNRQLSVGVCQERLPFELFIFDDQRVTLRSFNDQRKPWALVASEGEAVCRWARNVYESYRSVAPADEPSPGADTRVRSS